MAPAVLQTTCPRAISQTTLPSRGQFMPNSFLKFLSTVEVGCRGRKLLYHHEAKVLPAIEVTAQGHSQMEGSLAKVVEAINGRAAMLGITVAMFVEIATGQSLSTQLMSASSDPRVATLCALLALASAVPFIKGEMCQVCGPFNAQSELLQGRMAMLAFITLLFLEGAKGSVLL